MKDLEGAIGANEWEWKSDSEKWQDSGRGEVKEKETEVA